MKVFTTEGLVDFDRLTIQDVVELGENHRKVITQYRLGDTLVRQSVFVDILRPLEAGVVGGEING